MTKSIREGNYKSAPDFQSVEGESKFSCKLVHLVSNYILYRNNMVTGIYQPIGCSLR